MKFSRWLSGRDKETTENRIAPEPTLPRQAPDRRTVIARLAAQIEHIERGTRVADDAHWAQPGEAVAIRGAIIPGGAFYVGTALSSPLLHGDEPALVNPELPIELATPILRDIDMQYWPSYESLTAGQRATYMSWLASPRNFVELPIGYVFLYFYGFERRVFVDLLGTPELRVELPWIRAEVERLRRVYGSNPSLNGYAQRFLWATDCLGESTNLVEPPTTSARSWHVPDSVKLALGRLAAAGRPLPADWALAWLKSDPEAFLRTPAERCPDEFAQLFTLRYAERHGDGLALPTNERLRLEYRPASRSFGSIHLPIGDVPDVTRQAGLIAALRELGQECTDALDGFSRWIRRHPGDHSSLPAVALLPADMLRASTNPALAAMRTWLGDQLGDHNEAVVEGKQLLGHWSEGTKGASGPSGRLGQRDAAALCQLLATSGFGIEPDVRFGGPPLGPGPAVVFRDEQADPTAVRRQDRGTAILDFAMAVAAVRDPDDDTLDAVTRQLMQALELPAAERLRVRAHLHWLAVQSPNLNVAKKAMSAESHEAREEVGRFLVEWATQRGVVGPDQVSGLTKAFTALGLEPATLFSLIHQRAVNPSSEPIEIRGLGSATRGEAIPPPPPRGPRESVVLDNEALATVLANTAEATALLGQIFVDEEVPVAAPPPSEPGSLNGSYRDLLSQLAARSRWSPSEFASLSASLNLLPNRAMEVLNDAALDLTGDLLLEGDDVLEVNHDVVKELLE
jgi:TerB N-terminal domain/TerB-C domain